jgi:trehalose utilization protein
MKLIENVMSLASAEMLLEEHGIPWKCVRRMHVKSGVDFFSGETKWKMGDIYYFMDGDNDYGYWSSTMRNMIINEGTRQWAPSSMFFSTVVMENIQPELSLQPA